MKKHTNLYNEIEMHKPETDWYGILSGVVLLIASIFFIFAVSTFVIDVLPLIRE
jgi:hypothetical protein